MHINESQIAILSTSFPGTEDMDNVDKKSDDEVLVS